MNTGAAGVREAAAYRVVAGTARGNRFMVVRPSGDAEMGTWFVASTWWQQDAKRIADLLNADEQRTALPPAPQADAFQARVADWVLACFGPEIAADKQERNHRFIEEALELVQACGATASECHQLVDYVFGRDVGEPLQETGGVMVTLAALCNAHAINLDRAAGDELARVWTKVEKIRAKQAAKPKHSPLPEAPQADAVERLSRIICRERYRARHCEEPDQIHSGVDIEVSAFWRDHQVVAVEIIDVLRAAAQEAEG